MRSGNFRSVPVNYKQCSKWSRHPDTLAHPPWNVCYEILDWPLEFYHILWVIAVHFILQYLHRKKPSGRRSGKCGDHGNGPFLKITFPPNNSSRYLTVEVAVSGVAPSSWNCWLSITLLGEVAITRERCRLHFDVVHTHVMFLKP